MGTVVIVQFLSCVQLFATVGTAACQASLSFTISLPNLHQSVAPCLVLSVAFLRAYKFLRRQVKCSGIPIS